MTSSVGSAPPPQPKKLPDDIDDAAAAQAAASASTSKLPTGIDAAADATPTPTPAPPGAQPTPPPLPGAPAATAAPVPSAAPTSGDGFVADKIQTTDQAKPGQPPPQEIIPLAHAQSDYAAASAKVEELDKTLEGQLQEIGPGLKDQAQRDAYTAAFHQKYAAEYDAKANAANALANAVADPRNDFVATRDPAAAGQVANAVKTLATSPAAAGAESWLASKFGAGADPAVSAAYRPFFGDQAIADTAGDAAVNAASSGSADLGKLTGDLQSLANTGIGGAALRGNLKAAADLIAKASGTQPPPTPVAGAANKHVAPDVFEEAYKNGAGPKFEAAAYLMAAAKVAQGPGETPAEQSEYLGQIALAAQGGVAATNATAAQLANINAFQKYASQGVVNQLDALKASGLALDVAGRALGALAGVAFGAADIEKGVAEGNNGFRYVAAAGDLASAAGFVVEGATPLGLIGIGVAAVANKLADEHAEAVRNDEEAGLMAKAGVDPAVADTIAHHPNALASINGIGGVDGEQIQALAKANPEVFKTDDAAEAFAQVAKAAGLKGADVPAFAGALAQGPLGRDAVTQLAQDLKTPDGTQYGPAWLVDHVANHGAFPGAAGFLAQHAPKVVAEAAARSEADSQFDNVQRDPMQSGSAFSDGLAHVDSPVYRAQFIKDAAAKGVLPNAVSDRSGTDTPPAEKAMLVRALRDAASDGGISNEDANRYIAELG